MLRLIKLPVESFWQVSEDRGQQFFFFEKFELVSSTILNKKTNVLKIPKNVKPDAVFNQLFWFFNQF